MIQNAPNLLTRAFAKKLLEEGLSPDGHSLLKILDTLLTKRISGYQLDYLIDIFDESNHLSEVFRKRANEYNLDVPDFPKVSSVRTHIVSVYVDYNYILIPHNLGTNDYVVAVQGRYNGESSTILRQLNVPNDIQLNNSYDPITIASTAVTVFVPGIYVSGVYVAGLTAPIVFWTQNTNYNMGDLVIHKDKLYLCLKNHTSRNNGVPSFDSDFYADRGEHNWWLISQMLLIKNPNNHSIDNVLFIYHHNYEKAKKRIAYYRRELNDYKYTRKGVELYLRYLLDDNADIEINEKLTVTKIFKFYNYDSSSNTDNASEIGILKFNPTAPNTYWSYDGRPLSDDDPLILSPVSIFNPIYIRIRADLQPDIIRFIEYEVKTKLIPLQTWLAPQVNFSYDDYTQDWV